MTLAVLAIGTTMPVAVASRESPGFGERWIGEADALRGFACPW